MKDRERMIDYRILTGLMLDFCGVVVYSAIVILVVVVVLLLICFLLLLFLLHVRLHLFTLLLHILNHAPPAPFILFSLISFATNVHTTKLKQSFHSVKV